ALEKAMAERTPGGGGGRRRPKVFYATQVDVDPPHLVLFVNDPALFDESYRRFLLNRFRDLLPFEEVPIRLTLRARERPEEHGRAGEPSTRPRGATGKARPRSPKKAVRRPNRGR